MAAVSMDRRGRTIAENGIYYLIWLVVFAVTVIGYTEDGTIMWNHVGRFWLRASPLFLLFLLNNYILAPGLLLRKRYGSYAVAILIAIVAVAAFTALTHPRKAKDAFHPHGGYYYMERPAGQPLQDLRIPPPQQEPGCDDQQDRPPLVEFRKGPPPRPFIFKWGPAFGMLLFSLFIIGLNIAIKLVFKTISDARVMEQLERQSLRAELDYLKAQVNPHFFMNTLNNIHALVDIDTEKAKETIIELSKIMRYILYETDKTFVPVALEVKFIRNYASLMSIRFSGNVTIESDFPDTFPHARIPPLMLITLLENAFKHGVSYRKESFIRTGLEVTSQRLTYTVTNSLTDHPQGEKGVGLINLRKRLSLLYGEDFRLEVSSEEGFYRAVLEIPLIV